MHRQASERQPGDIHLFHRAPPVLQPIERSLGDHLQAGGVQLFEERSKREALARGKRFEVRERKRGDDPPLRLRHHLPHAVDGRGASRGDTDEPDFARTGGNQYRRTRVDRNVGDADKCRVQRVALAAQVVRQHAEADDVVRGREASELLLRDRHPIELTTASGRRTSRGRSRSSRRAPTPGRRPRSRAWYGGSRAPDGRRPPSRRASRPLTARTPESQSA